MGTRGLDVMIAGEHAGVLSQGESGALSFAYLRGYRGIPLSSAMPLSTRTYRDKVVLPYYGVFSRRTRLHESASLPMQASRRIIPLPCWGS